MPFRSAVAATLAFAAVLHAQEAPAKPNPETQLQQLSQEKQRLQKEIEFARKRVQSASSALQNKLRRGGANFRSIDAGRSRSSRVLDTTKKIVRKFARIGSPEEMRIGGPEAMIVVDRRAIQQQSYDALFEFLVSTSPNGDRNILAQRAIYDLMRLEGTAAAFLENPGKVQLGEALGKLQSGELSFAAAAKQYAPAKGASPDGKLKVLRNSVHGPLFEYMAFNTEVGAVSKPFLTPEGYAVLKATARGVDEQTSREMVECEAVLFRYSGDEKELLDALYHVTSGQAEVLVRDEEVMKLLPALYQPAKPKPNPPAAATSKADQMQLIKLQAALKQLIDKGEADTPPAKALIKRIQELKASAPQPEQQDAEVLPTGLDAEAGADQGPTRPQVPAVPAVPPRKPGPGGGTGAGGKPVNKAKKAGGAGKGN